MALNIGICGKRHFKESGRPVKKSIESTIAAILKKTGQTEFIGFTMLAQGADSIFASVVLDVYKQPINLILPFPKDIYEKNFTSAELKTFRHLFNRATYVTVLNPLPPRNDNEKNEAYRKAGLEIAKISDKMVFVWDGMKPSGPGGTAEILSYYAENYRLENLHIINTYPAEEASLQNKLEKAFDKSNEETLKYKKKHGTVWWESLLWGWLAAAFFSVKVGFGLEQLSGWLLAFAELVSFAIALYIATNGRRKAYHKYFLKNRRRTEQLRLLILFFHVGIKVEVPMLIELGDTELLNLINNVNNESNKFLSKWYANYVIKQFISSQKTYHAEKIKKMGGKVKPYEKANKIIVNSILIIVFIDFGVSYPYLAFKALHEWIDLLKHLMTMLGIILPASYAAIEGIMFFQEWKKSKNHSVFVKKNLEDCQKNLPQDINEIDDTICIEQQVKIIKDIATIMLNDNLSWQIIFEEKSNYHWVV